jgi:hypothetical protein
MRAAVGLLVVCFALLICPSANAAEAVDLALVLAADVSRSIDNTEFELQRKGYASAFTAQRVLSAIRSGPHQAIAVSLVEWSGPLEQKVVVDWMIVRDQPSGEAFAAAVLEAPRSFSAFTSISAALIFSMAQLERSGVEASRRVIDVSGDGTNNSGPPITAARDQAIAAGLTINGLAIINLHPTGGYIAHTQPPEGLAEYYRQNVIGGPGAFHLVIEDFSSFANAIESKLIREIAGRQIGPRLAASGMQN